MIKSITTSSVVLPGCSNTLALGDVVNGLHIEKISESDGWFFVEVSDGPLCRVPIQNIRCVVDLKETPDEHLEEIEKPKKPAKTSAKKKAPLKTA